MPYLQYIYDTIKGVLVFPSVLFSFLLVFCKKTEGFCYKTFSFSLSEKFVFPSVLRLKLKVFVRLRKPSVLKKTKGNTNY